MLALASVLTSSHVPATRDASVPREHQPYTPHSDRIQYTDWRDAQRGCMHYSKVSDALAPPSYACAACCLCVVQILFEEFGFSSFLEAPASYFSLQYACTLPPLQTAMQPPGEATTAAASSGLQRCSAAPPALRHAIPLSQFQLLRVCEVARQHILAWAQCAAGRCMHHKGQVTQLLCVDVWHKGHAVLRCTGASQNPQP